MPQATTEGGEKSPSFVVIDRHLRTQSNVANSKLAENFHSSVARGLPEFLAMPGIGKGKGDAQVSLVGGGPSMQGTLHELSGTVIACGSSHRYLVGEQGITPHYAVICDALPAAAKFIQTPDHRCTYLVASTCDPSVFDALDGYSVYIWHLGGIPETEKLRQIGGGCTVGLRSISIAIALGYSNLHLFGFDSCFLDKASHSYPMRADEFNTITVKVVGTDREFETTPELLAQANHFIGMAQKFGGMFSATVHGDGLIAEIMRHGAHTQGATA